MSAAAPPPPPPPPSSSVLSRLPATKQLEVKRLMGRKRMLEAGIERARGFIADLETQARAFERTLEQIAQLEVIRASAERGIATRGAPVNYNRFARSSNVLSRVNRGVATTALDRLRASIATNQETIATNNAEIAQILEEVRVLLRGAGGGRRRRTRRTRRRGTRKN